MPLQHLSNTVVCVEEDRWRQKKKRVYHSVGCEIFGR